MESIEKQEDSALLTCLIELAETTPTFLRSQLPVVMELCFKVCQFMCFRHIVVIDIHFNL